MAIVPVERYSLNWSQTQGGAVSLLLKDGETVNILCDASTLQALATILAQGSVGYDQENKALRGPSVQA